jgi:hypothetical protein
MQGESCFVCFNSRPKRPMQDKENPNPVLVD